MNLTYILSLLGITLAVPPIQSIVPFLEISQLLLVLGIIVLGMVFTRQILRRNQNVIRGQHGKPGDAVSSSELLDYRERARRGGEVEKREPREVTLSEKIDSQLQTLDYRIVVLQELVADANRAIERLTALQKGEEPEKRPLHIDEETLDVDWIRMLATYGFSHERIASKVGASVDQIKKILAQ